MACLRLRISQYLIICLLAVCVSFSTPGISLACEGGDGGGGGSLYGAGIQALIYGWQEISWQYSAGHESNATIRSNGWAYYLEHPTDCSGMVKVSLALQNYNPPDWSTTAIYNDTTGQYTNVSTGSVRVGDVAVWQGHMGMITAVNANGTVDISNNEGGSIGHAHVDQNVDPSGTGRWGTNGSNNTKYRRYSGN